MNERKRGAPMGHRLRGWRALAAGGAVAVAGLAIPLTGSLSAGAATAKIPHGGVIKIAVNSFPTGLGPIIAPVVQYNSAYAMEAIYGLLGDEDGTTGAVHYVFLKTMTPSNGFKTWDVVLKPGIKFSDGTLLNASAIQYTITQLVNPKNAYQYLAQMKGWKMKVVSTYDLQITLPSADAQFPGEMTQEFPFIASPTAWAKEGTAFNTKPVGAGAFTLKSFTANSTVDMVANTHYTFAPGQPYVSEIIMNNFPTSQTQMMNALTTGQDNLAWVQGKQQIDQAAAAGMVIKNFPSSGGLWLTMNTQKPPFNNLKARQAVNLALSHQGQANAWVPGSTAMTEIFAKNSPFYDAQYVNPAENDAKAQTMFNQLAASGDPVKFTFTDLSGYEGIAEYLQSHLDTYKNVAVKISVVQVGPYISDSVNDTFQMIPQGAQYANPWPALANAVETGGPINYGKWSDPKVDAAIASLKSSTSAAVAKAAWTTVLQEVQAQVPFFTAQGTVITTVYAKNVHGFIGLEYGQMPLAEQLYIQ